MSQTIDSRVVEMKFDNSQFEKNVQTTLQSLEKLDKKVNDLGKNDTSMSQIADAVGKVKEPAESAATSMEKLNKSMSLPGRAIAEKTIWNLTNSFYNLGKSVLASVSQFNAMRSGFGEYELKMGSIQTIMASTGASVDKVNGYLNELNTYSDKTIYSFSDMTDNIGKFTNAGVKLDVAVKAIQGIANEAAVSGANANEASRAMYNFAQALSAGYVKLIDWKSIENANMATKEFKQQLIDTAVKMGTLKKVGENSYQAIAKNAAGSKMKDTMNSTKNFNDSLQFQWMTSKVLTKTLGKYADETTKIGKKAFAAAQDIKTFSQLIDTLKESLGSQWAQTFEYLFGNIEQAKKLWTSLNQAISPILERRGNRRNEMLKYWAEFGGRDAIVKSFQNIKKAITRVAEPIRKAFDSVFPKSLNSRGKLLVKISEALEKFSKKLVISYESSRKLQAVFTSVFQAIKNFIGIIKQAITGLKPFIDRAKDLAERYLPKVKDALLLAVGAVAYFVSAASKWILQNEYVRKSIEAVTNFINRVVSKAKTVIDQLTKGTIDLSKYFGKTGKIAQKAFAAVFDTFKKLLGMGINGLGKRIKTFFEVFNDTYLPAAINAISVALKKFWDFMMNTAIPTAIKHVSTVLEGFWLLFRDNALIPTIEKVTSLLYDLADFFGGTFAKAIEKASSILESFGITLKRTTNDSVKTATLIAPKMVEATTNPVYNFINGLKGKMAEFKSFAIKFANTTVNVFKSINEFFKGDSEKWTIDRVLDLGQSTAYVSILWEIKNALSGFNSTIMGSSGLISGFNGLVAAATGTIKGFTGVLTAQSKLLNAKAIKELAVSVAILAGAVTLISLIPQDKLWASVAAIGALSGVIFGFVKVLSKIDIKAFGPVVAAFSVAMISLGIGALGAAAAIGALTAALVVLKKMIEYYAAMDSNVFVTGMARVAETIKSLATFLASIGIGAVFAKNAGIALLALAVALIVLYKAINQFAKIKPEVLSTGLARVQQAIESFSGFIKSLTLPALASSLGLDMAGIALNILAFVVALKTIVKSIQTLGKMDQTSLNQGIDAVRKIMRLIDAFLAVLALSSASLSMGRGSIFKKGAGSMKGMASSILALSLLVEVMGGVVSKFAALDTKSLKQGTKAFSLFIAEIGAFIVIASKWGNAQTIGSVNSISGLLVAITATVGILGSLPVSTIVKGATAMGGVLIALGVVLKASSNMGDIKGMAGLAVMAGVIAALGATLVLLAGQPWEQIIAAAVAMDSAIVVVFGALMAVVRGMAMVKTDDLAKFIVVVAGLAVVGTMLYSLAQYDWKTLAAAGAAMAGTVAVMAAVVKAMQQALDLKSIVIFASAVTGVYFVAMSIEMLAELPFDSMIGAGIALSAVVASIGACIALMSIGNQQKQVISFTMVVMAVIAVGMTLKELAAIPWQNLAAATALMVAAMVSVVGAMSLFSKMPAQMAPVYAGVLKLGLLIGEIVGIIGGILAEISLLAAALGHLTSVPIIHDGIKKLSSLFGEIQGAFQSAKASAGTKNLPEVGKRIKDFSAQVTPFFDLLKQTPVEEVNKFVDAMSKLGSVDFANFNKSNTDISKISTDLGSIGKALVDFTNSASNVNVELVTQAIDVIEKLGSISISSEGILLGKKDSITRLKEGLAPLGQALADFCTNVASVDMISVANASDAINKLGTINMPEDYASNIKTLSTNLPSLGIGLKGLSDNMGESDISAIAIAIKKLNALSKIKSLPDLSEAGDLKTQIEDLKGVFASLATVVPSGEDNLDQVNASIKIINILSRIKAPKDMGDMSDLAANITAIGSAIGVLLNDKNLTSDDVTPESIAERIKLITALSKLSNKTIPTLEGAEDFSTNVTTLAQGIGKFVSEMGKNGDTTYTVDDIKEKLGLIKQIAKMGGEGGKFSIPSLENASSFKTGIDNISQGITALITGLKGADGKDISTNQITEKLDVIKKLNGLNNIKIPALSNATAFNTGIGNIAKGIKSLIDGFKKGGISGDTIQPEELDVPIKIMKKLNGFSGLKIPSFENATSFATGASGMGKAVKDLVSGFVGEDGKMLIDSKQLDSAIATLNKLSKIKDIPKLENGATFSSNLNKVSKAVVNFKDTLSGVNPSKLVNKVKGFEGLNGIKLDKDAISSFVSGLKSMGDSGVKSFVSAISGAKGAKSAGETLVSKVKSGISTKGFYSLGGKIASTFISGVNDNDYKQDAYNAGYSLGSQVKAGAKAALDTGSPSKEMFKIGAFATEGFINGLKDKAKQRELDKRAKETAEKPKKIAEETLEVHSPSKVMYKIGKFAVQGFINGIKESNASKWSRAYMQKAFQDIINDTKGFANLSKKLGIQLTDSMKAAWISIYKTSDHYKEDQKALKDASKSLAKSYNSMTKALKKYKKAVKGVKSISLNKIFGKKILDNVRKQPEKATKRLLKGVTALLKKIRKKIGKSKFAKIFGKDFFKKLAKKPLDAIKKLEKGLNKLGKNKSLKKYVKGLKAVVSVLKNILTAQKSVETAGKNVWKNMKDAVEEWRNSIQEAFKSATSLSTLEMPMDIDFTGKTEIKDERLDAIDDLKDDWKDAKDEYDKAYQEYMSAKSQYDDTAEKNSNAWDYDIGRSNELKSAADDAYSSFQDASDKLAEIEKQMAENGAINVRINVSGEVEYDDDPELYYKKKRTEWAKNIRAQLDNYKDYYNQLDVMSNRFLTLFSDTAESVNAEALSYMDWIGKYGQYNADMCDERNVKAYKAYVEGIKNAAQEGMNAATKGMSTVAYEFMKHLKDLGYSEMDTIKMINSMTDEELKNGLAMFQEYEQMNSEQMLKSYTERINDTAQFYANMRKLAQQGLSLSNYSEFLEMGPEQASKIVAALLSGTAEQVDKNIEELNAAAELRMQRMQEASLNGLKGYASTFTKQAQEDLKKGKITSDQFLETIIPDPKSMSSDAVMEAVAPYADQVSAGQIANYLKSKGADSMLITQYLTEAFTPSSKAAGKLTGSAIVKGITSAIKKGIDSITKAFKSTLSSANSSVKKSSAVTDFKSVGKAMAKAIASGIASGKSSIISAATSAAKSAFEAAMAELNATASVASTASKTAETSGKKKAHDSGLKIVDGLIMGLTSTKSKSKSSKAGESVAGSVAKGIKNTLKIKSPSRLTYQYGIYTVEGFVNGINENVGSVSKAGENVAKAISQIPEIIDSDMDSNPVITPVIDLDNAESQIGKLNGMFGSQSIGLAANVSNGMKNSSGIQNGSTTNNKYDNSTQTQNNNFYITGNDPKAIADEVGKILQKKVNRRNAAWA